MKKIFIISAIFVSTLVHSQTVSLGKEKLVSTAMPFLTLRSDARANALGNTSVATASDVYSQNRNASKYVFFEDDLSIAFNHTRFLNSAFDDINDNSLYLVHRRNNRSAWAGSINYYDMGKLSLKDNLGNTIGESNPYDLSIDLSYSLLLSEHFSMGITGRFLNTRLEGIQGRSIGSGLAFDLSGYYQSEKQDLDSFSLVKTWGFSLQNIGSKLKYNNDEQEYFLPTTLRLGGGLAFSKSTNHEFSVTAEVGKLLVPEQPEYGYTDSNNNGVRDLNEPLTILSGKNPQRLSSISGMFEGFGNSSWLYSGGITYTYNDTLSLRTGYYGESKQAGNRNFVGLGAGIAFNRFVFDVSYTKTLQSEPHPLDNNLRLSLSYRMN